MDWSRRKVLIIDDEERIRSIFVRLCVEEGMLVRWASNAQEALNILIREDLDLVLLDINIPGIDGKQIFDVIREYDPSLKIIIASVYPIHVQKMMVKDANEYFDKYHGTNRLLEMIQEVFA